jgi:hypothetical protein
MVLISLLFLAGAGQAADLNVAYVTRNNWRGYDLNNGQPALQPGITVPLGNSPASFGV